MLPIATFSAPKIPDLNHHMATTDRIYSSGKQSILHPGVGLNKDPKRSKSNKTKKNEKNFTTIYPLYFNILINFKLKFVNVGVNRF